MKPLLANKNSCTGCMTCVDACSFGALKSKWADDGHIFVECDNEKCVGCGKCEKICPVVGSYSYKRDEPRSTLYATWANDDDIRAGSSSGGIFAPIAYQTIEKGGYVAGAVMEGISVTHILSNKFEDIKRMQGSKYQQGDASGVYLSVREKLKEGKSVFFTGVPCQIAGLYSFLGKLGDSKLLLTADLACSGFPSSLLLKKFVKEKVQGNNNGKIKIHSVKYRSKDKGWEKSKKIKVLYYSKDEPHDTFQKLKVANYGKNNLVYNGFSSGNTRRYSCGNCQFAFQHRKADLTLADFWNETRFPKEHYKGVSCVVVHSKAGKDIITKAKLFTFYSVEWKDFIPFNKLIYNKLPFLRLHPARLFLKWNVENLPFSILEKIYGKELRKVDVFWLPYKLLNFIIYKVRQKKKEKFTTKFINEITNEKN